MKMAPISEGKWRRKTFAACSRSDRATGIGRRAFRASGRRTSPDARSRARPRFSVRTPRMRARCRSSCPLRPAHRATGGGHAGAISHRATGILGSGIRGESQRADSAAGDRACGRGRAGPLGSASRRSADRRRCWHRLGLPGRGACSRVAASAHSCHRYFSGGSRSRAPQCGSGIASPRASNFAARISCAPIGRTHARSSAASI